MHTLQSKISPQSRGDSYQLDKLKPGRPPIKKHPTPSLKTRPLVFSAWGATTGDLVIKSNQDQPFWLQNKLGNMCHLVTGVHPTKQPPLVSQSQTDQSQRQWIFGMLAACCRQRWYENVLWYSEHKVW